VRVVRCWLLTTRTHSESLLERVPVIHCYPESTLREVVFKLVGARVHRLYIVSDSQSFVPVRLKVYCVARVISIVCRLVLSVSATS
jgi:hypothetical protein